MRKVRSGLTVSIICAGLLWAGAAEPNGLFPATGQTTAYKADKNDGIAGPVDVPDDGTVRAGAPLSYTDNLDGTITDNNTGLMWEMKDDSGGLHDKDTFFPWSGDGSQETIWDWLDDVNAEGGTGFAGYNDWRIPNVKELHSIVDYERVKPSIDPVFNTDCTAGCTLPNCSCTPEGNTATYWSSTTMAINFDFAWHVAFEVGGMNNNGKRNSDLVRAVRGGTPLIVPPLTISPPSGEYVTTQGFDLTLIVDATGLSVVGGTATFDGADVTSFLVHCIIPGTLLSGGVTFRCPGLTGDALGVGMHTFSVTLDLENGSSVSDTVTWEVLGNTEP